MGLTSESKMDIMDPEPDAKRNTNQKHLRKDTVTYLTEYCNKSGLHGLQYIAEGRTWYERVFWVLFVIASVSACIYMIVQIYVKWLQSPVLVSFATKKTPFYDVPFPSVTICPKVKIDLDKPGCLNTSDYRYKKKNQLPTTDDEERYAAFMHVMCDEEISETENATINSTDFYNYIKECEPERIVRIVFMNEYFELEFKDIFKPFLTEEGLCYSFNRLRMDEVYTDAVKTHTKNLKGVPYSEWHAETGYSEKAKVATYPRRGLVPNIKNGLGIYFFENRKNMDYICDPVMQGYTVTLHQPNSVPCTREDFFFVPFNSAVLAPIQARVTRTSDKVKSYAPHNRDCYFPSEKHLKFFRQYSQDNCFYECLSDYLLKKCGCVKFYMPKHQDTPVCGPSAAICTNKYELQARIESLKIKLGRDPDDDSEVTLSILEKCDCLPMCNDITYSTDAASFQINTQKVLEWYENMQVITPELANNPDTMTTYIMLYLKDSSTETTERNELYGPSDFLSNFGGLLGLFTGFSMLSCVEIIYFLTLRIFANIKLFGHWTGVPQAPTPQ